MSIRRKILLDPHAVIPVHQAVWDISKAKLDEAKLAINEMRQAKDRAKFEAGWRHFVDSIEEFWSCFFSEGKKNFQNFQNWISPLNTKRRDDPLLRYLIGARNKSQHDLLFLSWGQNHLKIAPSFNGHIQRLQIFNDGTFSLNTTSLDPTNSNPSVLFSPGDASLPTLKNKNPRTKEIDFFEAPKIFNGDILIESSPIDIAILALNFYTKMLLEAEDKFVEIAG